MDVRLALAAAAIAATVISVRILFQRRHERFARPPVTSWWLLWAALGVALLRDVDPAPAHFFLRPLGGLWPTAVVWLLAGAFVAVNIRRQTTYAQVGLLCFGLGFTANSWATAWNGGMPFSVEAAMAAGITESQIARPPPGHVRIDDGTTFVVLADILPVPLVHMVVSVGDVLMTVGVLLFIVTAGLRSDRRTHPSIPSKEVMT